MSLIESVTKFADSVTASQVAGGLAALAAVSFVRWYVYNLKVSVDSVTV